MSFCNIFNPGSLQTRVNHIGDIKVNVLTSSAENHGFEPRRIKLMSYNIGIRCLSAKQATYRNENKDLLVWNHDNISLCCFSKLAL